MPNLILSRLESWSKGVKATAIFVSTRGYITNLLSKGDLIISLGLCSRENKLDNNRTKFAAYMQREFL